MTRLRTVIWFLMVALTVRAAFSQVAGRLSGSVIDASGAVVPGATINVFLAGGQEPVLTGQSNEAGLFLFIAVRPDTYDLSIERQGFVKTTIRQVQVSPLQELQLPAIKLEVQTTSTSVEVTADLQTVQSSNAEVATTITTTMIQNLPVLGRQVSSFFQSQPGVSVSTDTTSVNGLKSTFSSVTLDGINIQDNFIRTNGLDYAPFRTTIDQIAEITVATSNQSAAIGGGASQFILSTKSGSNEFHGSVYWYNRNNAFSANDWFNDRDGVPQGKLNLNQPGAALGGRIIRDKLFFYGNVELYRNKRTTSLTRTVLTDSAKNGIFTYVDSAGATRTANLQTLRGYTPDPTIKGLIAQLPEPNSPGGDGLNTSGYRFNAKYNEFRDQVVYKSDYYITQKHSLTGTFNYISNPTDRPDISTSTFYTVTPPVTNIIKNYLLSLALRSTISPTLTNELRAGFARTHGNFDDNLPYPKFAVSTTNLLFTNPQNTFLTQGRDTNTYPIQDNANWIKGKHQVAFGFQFQRIYTTPFNDGNGGSETGIIPTYRLGISASNPNSLTTADLPGIRSTDLTRANNLYANLAGIITSAYQTFNVTSLNSGFVPGATNLRDLRYSTYAAYVQDNWKLRPNLTLNIGLRYEYWTPLDEKNGLYLSPVLENNNLRATLLDPNATLNFIGGPSGRPFYNANKANFAPNVGFAWSPFRDSKTSIRGGYMMAYVNDNVFTTMRSVLARSSGLSSAASITNLVAYLASPPTVPTPAFKVPRTLADNYAISKTSATGLPDPNIVTPKVHQWNLSLEQEFNGFILAGRYIGNKGVDLLRGVDYNQVLYNANGFLADFQRAQTNGTLAQAATGNYDPSFNASIPGSQPLTVFPLLSSGGRLSNATIQSYIRNGQVGGLADYYMTNGLNGAVNFYTNPNVQSAYSVVNGGSSIYHSLQLEMTKRTRSGLQVQFSYVYGKALSNMAGDSQTNVEPYLDNSNPNLEWARTPYDIRHSFKANYYYELPFGAGKRWSSSSAVNKLIGGWAISGIWSYYSGSPFSILSGANGLGWGTLNRDGLSTYTNTASVVGTNWSQLQSLTSGVFKTGDNVYFISPTLIGADGRGTSQPGTAPFAGQVFYNPAAGNVGNLQRRMFSGPWQWSWDMSVKKSIHFTERHTLDLHLDVFNFANHPTFYLYPVSAGDYSFANPYEINNTTFGQLDTMNYNPRIIQIGAYYRF